MNNSLVSIPFATAIITAVILGIASGIIPGLHINTISAIMARSEILKAMIPLSLGIYLPLTIIPLILISSAEGSGIGSLFIIKKLRESKASGKALETAIKSCILGGIFSFLLYLTYPNLVKISYELIEDVLYYIVLMITLFLILKSNKKKAFFIIFLISGLVGILSFSMLHSEKFFPMFAGFFAIPSLLQMNKISEVKIETIKTGKLILPSLIGSFLGFISVLLPGISSPSIMISIISSSSSLNPIVYLAMSYSFMSSQAFNSFISYQEIGKARIGAISYSKGGDYLLFFAGMAIGALFAPILLQKVEKIKRVLSPGYIILLLLFMCLTFEGIEGIAIMAIASFTSIIREKEEVSGISHLGSIIIPVLLRVIL